MNSKAILSSDVLDILFENRNKEYGAYTLRKFYPNRIKASLLTMLGMAATVSAFTFLPDNSVSSVPYVMDDSLIVVQMQENKKPEPPKPTPPAAEAGPHQRFLSAVDIVHNEDSADVFNDITHLQISSYTDITPTTGTPLVGEPAVPGGGGGETTKVTAPGISNDHPEENPDVQASYPGGANELIRFLEKNLRSPEGLEEGESAQVKIKFVVGFDGNLQTFDVLQDGGADFNNEVIRVLKKMPKWNPGKKGGRNVPVYYCLPVKFAANE